MCEVSDNKVASPALLFGAVPPLPWDTAVCSPVLPFLPLVSYQQKTKLKTT